MSYTKEPWRVDYFNRKGLGYADGNPLVLVEAGPKDKPEPIANCLGTRRPYEKSEADAKRIVDCVNACAGLPDPKENVKELLEMAKVLAKEDCRAGLQTPCRGRCLTCKAYELIKNIEGKQ